MTIALTIEHGPHAGLPRAEILRRIKAMIGLLQLEKAEASFVLTNDERIHELNKVYRGKDKPTDVLAFAMHEGEFGTLAGDVLGDVIVSVPTARKQADEHGKHVLDEVTMLLAHGLLHLLGWDHDTDAKDRRMRAETDRLVRAAEAPSSKGRARSTASKRTPAAARSSAAPGKRKAGTRAPKSSATTKESRRKPTVATRNVSKTPVARPSRAGTASKPKSHRSTAKTPAKAPSTTERARSKAGAATALTPKKKARKSR